MIASCLRLNRRPVDAPSEARAGGSNPVASACMSKPKPFVTAVKSRPGSGKVADWLKKGSYGQVPSYLIERQIQMAAQLAEEQVCRTSMISALIAVLLAQHSSAQRI